MTGANYARFYAIVPKQPPPNTFFEAYSLFKEKNFDLSWRDCDICSLFDCAKLPLKCTYWGSTRVTFAFEKMVEFFSMTVLVVICVCIIFHTQLFLIQETLVTTTTIRTETIAWFLSQFSSRKILPTCFCNSNETLSIFLYILSVGGVNNVLWKFAFSLNTSKKRNYWLVLSTANLVITFSLLSWARFHGNLELKMTDENEKQKNFKNKKVVYIRREITPDAGS